MTATRTHLPEPLSDLAYDWVTIIQRKSESLRAYSWYIRDAEQAGSPECAALLRRIYEQDAEHVREAMQHLTALMRSGRGEQAAGAGQGAARREASPRCQTGASGMSQGGGEAGQGGASPNQAREGQQVGQGEAPRDMGPNEMMDAEQEPEGGGPPS